MTNTAKAKRAARAQAAYDEAQAEAAKLLAEITEALAAHKVAAQAYRPKSGFVSPGINFGHAGDVQHTVFQLREIANQMLNRGEYAPE